MNSSATYNTFLPGIPPRFNEFIASVKATRTPEYGYQGTYAYGAEREEEDGQDGGARKKAKRSHLPSEAHVCVTCGRTDSPEWRKGPMGPKTLCNACGLRWAKQMRKVDKEGNGGEADG